MAIEVPSYVVAYLILDRLGRKGTLVLLMLSGGASCFIASMINEEQTLAIIILSIGGKFCIAAAFAVIYIYTIEIFPTQYRSLGLGTCSMSARLGGIIAPFTAGMGAFYKPSPVNHFWSHLNHCGSLLILLPETLGAELPQTLEESENYGKDQPVCFFTCFQKKKIDDAKETEEIEIIKVKS
ncbi:Solute carrier family 22 member 16 [Armadillidium vulgare]|nr:Solute carrier family 22 member 16 [Armadillidium vulgare]